MPTRPVYEHMRQVRLSITPTDPATHPFCALTSGDGPIDEAQSLYCNVADGGRLTSLFAIRGEPGAISTDLDELSEVVRYDITTDVDDMCYVNVQIEMTGLVRTFFDIISREYITLVLPVVYTNGRATLELVGSDGSLQEAVDSLPATVHVDIEGIGEFTDGKSPSSILSERQYEAVLAGLELGYYQTPRRATHEDIAEQLDCSPSMASEHLNRAESKLIKAMLNRS